MIKSVLNEGEREFGATVIDLGGGQTTVASVRNQELQFTNIYQEGGDYVTKDISKVLKNVYKRQHHGHTRTRGLRWRS